MSDERSDDILGPDGDSPPEGVPSLRKREAAAGLAALRDAVDRLDAFVVGGNCARDFRVELAALAARRDVVRAYRDHPGEVDALFARVAAHKDMGARVVDMRRTLNAEARLQRQRESRAGLSVVEPLDSLRVADALREILGEHPIPDPVKLQVPYGWNLTPWKIERVSEDSEGRTRIALVAHGSLLLTGILEDTDEPERTLWHLEWHGQQWRRAYVPRGDCLNARRLIEHAGLPEFVATSANAGTLAEYLRAFEVANAHSLPRAQAVRRMGWLGPEGERGFMWGRRLLRADMEVPPDQDLDLRPTQWSEGHTLLHADGGAASIADGLRSAGTWEGALEAFGAAADFPVVYLGMVVSLAPPLLLLFPDIANHVFEWASRSSSGKTTAGMCAASMWGAPDPRGGRSFASTWKTTGVGFEQRCVGMSYFPTILDDTRDVDSNLGAEWLAAQVYHYCSGVAKTRGRRDGGLRPSPGFRGILMTTGEEPITSGSQGSAGDKARVISIRDFPFGRDAEKGKAGADRLERLFRAHYGHAGPRVVLWLLHNRDRWDEVREVCHLGREHAKTRGRGDPVRQRQADFVGLLQATAWVMRQLGIPECRGEWREILYAASDAASAEADRPADALRQAYDLAVTRQAQFWCRHQTRDGRRPMEPDGEPALEGAQPPPGGWLGRWDLGDWKFIGFTRRALTDLLQPQGYHVDSILAEWKARGWIRVNGAHLLHPVRIQGELVRVCYVPRAAFEAVAAPVVGAT